MTAPPEPRTFKKAVSRFEEFLRQNSYPPNLVWVEPTDLLLSGRGAIYVKLPVPAESPIRARERFGLGMNKGLELSWARSVTFGTRHAVRPEPRRIMKNNNVIWWAMA